MHHTEANRIRKEIWRLALAEQDMRLVARAVDVLADEQAPCRLVIEAGMVVTYCRSFSGPPKDGWARRHVVDELAPEGALHATLFEIRSKLYAHTDSDYRNRREAIDVYGNHSYLVEYRLLNPKRFLEIKAFALALADRFERAREERQRTLRDAGVKPERYEGSARGVAADW